MPRPTCPLPSRGAERVREWLFHHRRSQSWLAREIATAQQNVSRWMRGYPIPLHMAHAIYLVTEIPSHAWLEPVKGRAA